MPTFTVTTAARTYQAIVENGALGQLANVLPAKAHRVFVVTTRDVWALYRERVEAALFKRPFETLVFPGGEANKRFMAVENLAEQMIERGGDRSSVVIGFGGGI